MPDYWTGLIEGFQGRREGAAKQNFEREAQNRAMSDRVFQYLLQSRDPEIQGMAMQGLMQPTTKAKGMRGFLGDVTSVDPTIAQIVARMNEMVPDEGGGGGGLQGPPARPGSAAMPTNQPVRPGSAPIPAAAGGVPPQPTAPPPDQPDWTQPQETRTAPPIGPTEAGPPMLGGPPLPGETPHPLKRRGTSIPTAEEVAEMQARVSLETRIKVATQQLLQAGATPEEVQTAVMGMLGAPRTRQLSAVTQWGVKLPGSTDIVPVLLDQTQGYVTAGGNPLPPGAQMVRMSGGAGTGGLTSTVRDSPEARQWLIEQGADPATLQGGSPSGYWHYKQAPGGPMQVQAGEFTPAPAYSGTLETTDPTNPRVPVRRPVLRGGGVGPPLGDVDQPVKSQSQLDAEALQTAVDDEVKLVMGSTLGRVRGISPAARDQIVRTKARTMHLPYATYDQVVQATKAAQPVSTRERAEGGTLAERVRARALANRQGVQPAAAPTPPPARARGAGPGR